MYTVIAEELNLRWHQVKSTVELLDADNTVPFIARYRKEATGSLDEEQIRAIQERIKYLRNLEERKQAILKSIEEQGKLTPELAEKIAAADKLQELEDLYLPYKPKRRTRATMAREKGLEPLALMILAQETLTGDALEYALPYVDAEKGVESPEAALAGARDICAETVSDDAPVRQAVRELTLAKGFLASEAKDPDNCKEYEIYKQFSEPVKTVPPHRILAINRGERENFLRAGIDAPEAEMILEIEKLHVTQPKSIFTAELRQAIADAYHRLIAPAIEREIRNQLSARADDHAIRVFAQNLRALLMQAPLRGQVILGIDPGFRTGCKIAAIDRTGKYLDGSTIYPHEPQRRWNDLSYGRHHVFQSKNWFYCCDAFQCRCACFFPDQRHTALECVQYQNVSVQRSGCAAVRTDDLGHLRKNTDESAGRSGGVRTSI